jgi:hypothetical protein
MRREALAEKIGELNKKMGPELLEAPATPLMAQRNTALCGSVYVGTFSTVSTR